MSEPTLDALMEKQQVLDFFAAVLQDESLLEQLMAFVDAKDNVAIIKLAGERGYKFSEKSLREGIKNIVNLVAPIDESGKLRLSDIHLRYSTKNANDNSATQTPGSAIYLIKFRKKNSKKS